MIQIICRSLYQDATSSLGCKVCSLGYYSSAYASSSWTQCPQGSYWPNADQPPILCPFGTYSSAGSVIWQRCTDGYLWETGETTPTPSGKTWSNGFICNPARQLQIPKQLLHNCMNSNINKLK